MKFLSELQPLCDHRDELVARSKINPDLTFESFTSDFKKIIQKVIHTANSNPDFDLSKGDFGLYRNGSGYIVTRGLNVTLWNADDLIQILACYASMHLIHKNVKVIKVKAGTKINGEVVTDESPVLFKIIAREKTKVFLSQGDILITGLKVQSPDGTTHNYYPNFTQFETTKISAEDWLIENLKAEIEKSYNERIHKYTTAEKNQILEQINVMNQAFVECYTKLATSTDLPKEEYVKHYIEECIRAKEFLETHPRLNNINFTPDNITFTVAPGFYMDNAKKVIVPFYRGPMTVTIKLGNLSVKGLWSRHPHQLDDNGEVCPGPWLREQLGIAYFKNDFTMLIDLAIKFCDSYNSDDCGVIGMSRSPGDKHRQNINIYERKGVVNKVYGVDDGTAYDVIQYSKELPFPDGKKVYMLDEKFYITNVLDHEMRATFKAKKNTVWLLYPTDDKEYVNRRIAHVAINKAVETGRDNALTNQEALTTVWTSYCKEQNRDPKTGREQRRNGTDDDDEHHAKLIRFVFVAKPDIKTQCVYDFNSADGTTYQGIFTSEGGTIDEHLDQAYGTDRRPNQPGDFVVRTTSMGNLDYRMYVGRLRLKYQSRDSFPELDGVEHACVHTATQMYTAIGDAKVIFRSHPELAGTISTEFLEEEFDNATDQNAFVAKVIAHHNLLSNISNNVEYQEVNELEEQADTTYDEFQYWEDLPTTANNIAELTDTENSELQYQEQLTTTGTTNGV